MKCVCVCRRPRGSPASFLEADPRGAIAVYLFGSVARGEARAGSDIDLGVLLGRRRRSSTRRSSHWRRDWSGCCACPSGGRPNRARPTSCTGSCVTGACCSTVTAPPASVSRCSRATSTSTWRRSGRATVATRHPPGPGSTAWRSLAGDRLQLVAKKLAFVETCVQQLRTLARPELLGRMSASSASSSTRSSSRFRRRSTWPRTSCPTSAWGNPKRPRGVPAAGTSRHRCSGSRRASGTDGGLRNVVVHLYQEVDLGIVRTRENRLDDLLEFVADIRRRL